MFNVKIEDSAVMAMLARLEHAGHDLAPAMQAIAAEMLSQTEANLAAEGRPKWLPLKAATIEARTVRGAWPGMIMQDSGQLAASYHAGADAVSAWVGSNKKYAAIQNLGGTAGRGHSATIAARPSLPLAAGALQPQAADAVTRMLRSHFGAAL